MTNAIKDPTTPLGDPPTSALQLTTLDSRTEPTSNTPQMDQKSLRGRLLTLPLELRHEMYRYMTLSPFERASLSWHGLYLTNKQLMREMRAFLNPDPAFSKWIQALREDDRNPPYVNITCSAFDLIHTLTLSIPIPHRRKMNHGGPPIVIVRPGAFVNPGTAAIVGRPSAGSDRHATCIRAVERAYELYIPHVHVILTGNPYQPYSILEDYGDLKSLNDRLFMTYVKEGSVNCKAVSFTVEMLEKNMNQRGGEKKHTEKSDQNGEGENKANGKGRRMDGEDSKEGVDGYKDSRAKETTIINEVVVDGGGRLVYSLTITQDKEERLFRKRYASETRFKAEGHSEGS
ncbi:hypothetical protein DM02DRAFT_656532 [Periconia macrospinosa]|uniref:Uncharacterized protein n=1 Tax=Periconia macrospinosa TaxID=97972 RepID=A0A2V1DMF4_9PLEO|nr:hypothetical protein DM02DRAFT_656532 [Periconia macrospinosa]